MTMFSLVNADEFSFRFVESCTDFNKSFTMQADLGLNVLFLIYFFLRVCFICLHWNVIDVVRKFSLLPRSINDDFGLVSILSLICLQFHLRLSPCISIEIGSVKEMQLFFFGYLIDLFDKKNSQTRLSISSSDSNYEYARYSAIYGFN